MATFLAIVSERPAMEEQLKAIGPTNALPPALQRALATEDFAPLAWRSAHHVNPNDAAAGTDKLVLLFNMWGTHQLRSVFKQGVLARHSIRRWQPLPKPPTIDRATDEFCNLRRNDAYDDLAG
jgi:hypothetical protein